MNAVLNIQVRVLSQEAQAQLKSLQTQVNQMAQGVNRAGGAAGTGGFSQSLDVMSANLIKTGKNMQWVGRQMEYAFTLPVIGAGAYATKIALDNAKASTELAKVYGLLGTEGINVTGELSQLNTTMELLSDRFGVQQSKVLDVAKAWAEAGSSGVGLARSVQNTLEASVVGTMDLTTATSGLISVQSAYHMSSSQLRTELANLDLIQVQSGISFSGLIDVIQRAGSTAAVAGIDIRHLSAMAAAIVPAAGTASQAGNALRTIISRMLAPTKDAADLMQKMGINITDASWSTATGTKRFEMLAAAIGKLPDSQKLVVDTFVAARFQLNRFSALMADATKQNGYYQSSLRNTADPVKALALYSQQLNTVLGSSPQRLQILKTELQNSLARVIIPLLPALLGFVERITALVTWFSHLNPEVQQFITGALLMLALVGPLLRYVGAFRELGGIILWVFGSLIGKGAAFAQWVTTTLPTIYAGFVGFFETVALRGMYAWDAIVSGAQTAAILAMSAWETAVGGIETAWIWLSVQGSTIGTFIAGLWETIAIKSLYVWEEFSKEVVYLFQNFPAVMNAVGGFIVEMWGNVVTFLATGWSSVTDFILRAWVNVGTFLGQAWEAVSSAILSISVQASTLVVQAWEAAGRFLAAVPDLFLKAWIIATNLFAEVWTTVTEFLTTAWGVAGDFLMKSWIVVTNFLSAAWEGAMDAVLVATTWMETSLPVILRTIPLFFSVLTTSITRLWRAAMVIMSEDVMGFALSAVSSVVEAAGGIVAAIAAVAGLPEEVIIVAIIGLVLAVTILLTRFKDQFRSAFQSIVDMASKLPGALVQIFQAVVNVVATAIKAVINWLSYLNPFARHSPSLVDMVSLGTQVVSEQYRQMAMNIASHLTTAKSAHTNFQNAVAGTQSGFDLAELQGTRNKIVQQVPGAAPQIDAMVGQIVQLKGVLHDMDPLIADQQRSVDGWKSKLDAANAALDQQNSLLNDLKDRASKAKDALDSAKQVLTDLANTPIQGMKAMNDQIFANEMAQKQLRLEIMKLQDAGGSVEDITQKMSALQGEIEKLRGEASDLRLAGAGSDVLGPIGDQIKALQAQQSALSGPNDQMTQLQQQLAALEQQGQELDLQNSLQFDPLKKQIDDVTNSMKEMPFDELMRQITTQKTNVDQLQSSWDAANAAVVAQQAVVDQYKASSDDIQKSYDAENTKLEALKQSYSDVTDQINAMKSSMDTLSSSIDKSKSAESMADKLFNAPAGPLPDVTGGAQIGREADQSIDAFNKQIQDSLDQMGKDMGKLDPFKPFKDMFKSAWAWIKDHAKPIIVGTMIVVGAIILEAISLPVSLVVEGIALLLYAVFGPKVFGAIARSFMSIMGTIWRFILSIWHPIVDVFTTIFSGIGDVLSWVWNNIILPIWDALTSYVTMVVIPVLQAMWGVWSAVWNLVMIILQGAWGFIEPILEAFIGFFHDYILPVLELFGAIVEIVFAAVGLLIFETWTHVIWPVLKALWNFISNDLGSVFMWLWNDVIAPVFGFIGDKATWLWQNALYPAFSAAWDFITNTLGPVFGWLWHTIIEPVFSGIGTFFSDWWTKTVKPVFDGVKWFIENVLAPVFGWLKDTIITPVFNGIGKIIKDVWDAITQGIKVSVNFVIDAFNKIADVVNSIGDALHVSIHVGHMPNIGDSPAGGGGGGGFTLHAQGGMVASRATAIVGEGRAGFPEYVIPTDPQFRQRALLLYRALGASIVPNGADVAGMQFLAGGGILGGLGSIVGNAAGAIGGVIGDIKNAVVNGIVSPAFMVIDHMISLIPDGFFKDIATSIRNELHDYAVGVPAAYNGAIVRGSAAGTLIRAGERNQTEAIVPLPNGGLAGGREIHFHGQLVFPNVRTGDDAKAFIRNLESLAG